MNIEKLSQAQEVKMQEVKKYWLDYIFSCKHSLDRDKAKMGIDWLYKMTGRPEPIIIFVDSPMACQYAFAYLKEFVKMFPQIFNMAPPT